MAAVARPHGERDEVEAVLKSGIFDRAPNVERFFRYVCERYLAGEADKVKEYNIAVEALGRSAAFDQKRDSIVRVEAHRLRKRLSEYYSARGLNHTVQITLPAGQYVPKFVFMGPADGLQVAPANGHTIPIDATAGAEMLPARGTLGNLAAPHRAMVQAEPESRSATSVFFWISVFAFCAAAGAYLIWSPGHGRAAFAAEVWKGSWEPVESEIRLLAGSRGGPFHDRQGRIWAADCYYTGGVSRTAPARPYEGLPDAAFTRSYREGAFRYDIPVVPGTYELRLYFIEAHFGEGNPGGGAVNSRMFRVGLNGKPLLELFDALSEAGAPNRLHTRVFRDVSPAADGKLHLVFQPMNEAPAFLTALELLPTSPGKVRPIRIVAQTKNAVDTGGVLWQADEYAVGGTQVDRATVANEPERMLFRGERYGSFSYHIPVAAGRYRLRLFFAETFFGTDLPFARNNPAGPRIFNVFVNGTALLRDLDVSKEANGPYKPLIKDFENLEPNAQGLLLLEFVPVHNYAEVNAIEVTQME